MKIFLSAPDCKLHTSISIYLENCYENDNETFTNFCPASVQTLNPGENVAKKCANIYIENRRLPMALILDGNSEHIAPVWINTAHLYF